MKVIARNTMLVFFVFFLFSLLVQPPFVNAASVRQVDIDEMLQQCQLVFEGKVVSLVAKEVGPKRIRTYVTFEIHEVIKGEQPGGAITLSFLGGTVDGLTMAVSDMEIPQVGEQGIYFVESLERVQAHPLYGWSQGHFLVEPDDTGAERVKTNGKKPVTAVGRDLQTLQMNARQEQVQSLSMGVVGGVTLAPDEKSKGMTTAEFKKALREKMKGYQ